MRIALVGFGGVGRAFVELLEDKKEYLKDEGLNISLNYIICSRGGIYNPEGIDLSHLMKFSKQESDITKYPFGGSNKIGFINIMENRDIDLLVEMTPTNKETGEPGMTHITESLKMGIHVVTANKGPVLLAYKKLRDIALENRVQLGIGCTTGGALPTINGGIVDMAGSNILSIEGVLNGTTNFILNEMEKKRVTYEEALKRAQELGIAERNPYLDVEGWDTAIKLLILTNILMNEEMTIKDISVEGITKITLGDMEDANRNEEKYKLLGKTVVRDGRLMMSVAPQRLDKNHPLYGVEGKNKAVRYTSDTLGDLTIIGGASGVTPAAASVLRDIINICRGYRFVK